MSYQVLARKWRPRFFDEMIGQEHVLKALINALDNDRLHHAYLFTGTRGVGKTTVARVLAKCLNCEQGVSSKPCGECSACVAIDEGRFVDLIEVDAASRAKVDETRELMDNVQYAPSVGRYKVYLIDEVHMFSNHSFNALLKTLEEPPPHVKFLLATTESKKVPVTILSRCLQFNLKYITVDQIEKQLIHILENENVTTDETSCRLIAKAANGSLRDALSLLDQAIAYGGGELKQQQVQSMLGAVDSTDLIGLVSNVLEGDAKAAFANIQQIAEHNPDYDQVLTELLSLLQTIAVLQIAPNDSEPDLMEIAKGSDKELIQLLYQIALTGRRDLYLSPDVKMGFDMTIIRMLAFKPQTPAAPGDMNKIVGNDAAEPTLSVTDKTQNVAAAVSQQSPTDNKKTVNSNVNDWNSLIQEMSLAGLTKEFANHCVLDQLTENKIELYVCSDQEHLLASKQKDNLEQALKDHFGSTLKISISVKDVDAETPAQKRLREQQEAASAAKSSIENDPNINALAEAFGAAVDENSIKPV